MYWMIITVMVLVDEYYITTWRICGRLNLWKWKYSESSSVFVKSETHSSKPIEVFHAKGWRPVGHYLDMVGPVGVVTFQGWECS